MSQNVQTRLKVHVQPGAKQNQIAGLKEGLLYIRITAPPVAGKANEALIKFLSKKLAVSKSHISIDSGLTGRLKTVTISGLSESRVLKQLLETD
jgi:uncharacterized protein (TIGR00251 family)